MILLFVLSPKEERLGVSVLGSSHWLNKYTESGYACNLASLRSCRAQLMKLLQTPVKDEEFAAHGKSSTRKKCLCAARGCCVNLPELAVTSIFRSVSSLLCAHASDSSLQWVQTAVWDVKGAAEAKVRSRPQEINCEDADGVWFHSAVDVTAAVGCFLALID